MNLRYFKEVDFGCACGQCSSIPRPETMLLADELRHRFGHPLNVNSGARCRDHTLNLRKKGIPAALNSRHHTGDAVDLAPVDKRLMADFHDFLLKEAESLSFWIEDPRYTLSWGHVQVVPYGSWKSGMPRTFKP